MIDASLLDLEEIRRVCELYGVERLRIFGSALTDRFDAERSDVDFLVDFLPGRDDLLSAYLDLKSELERILSRDVDLVMASSVKNPFFKASAFKAAQDVYATYGRRPPNSPQRLPRYGTCASWSFDSEPRADRLRLQVSGEVRQG